MKITPMGQRIAAGAVAVGIVQGTLSLFLPALFAQTMPNVQAVQSKENKEPAVIALAFRDFFEPTPRELRLSDKLRRLNGRRVRITGFIARMEVPPKGAFFLCAQPVTCNEAGGGTADLPPETVRVIVRSANNKIVQSIPRPVVVTGLLEVGNRSEADGTMSSIRLILDRPQAPTSSRIRTLTSPKFKAVKPPGKGSTVSTTHRKP